MLNYIYNTTTNNNNIIVAYIILYVVWLIDFINQLID